MQEEDQRVQWDTFIDSCEVLEKSLSGRMQVVKSQYTDLAGQGARELIEKKIHFRHTEDPEEARSHNNTHRARHRTISPRKNNKSA